MEAPVRGADTIRSYLVSTQYTKHGVPKVVGLPRAGSSAAGSSSSVAGATPVGDSDIPKGLKLPSVAIRPGRVGSSRRCGGAGAAPPLERRDWRILPATSSNAFANPRLLS